MRSWELRVNCLSFLKDTPRGFDFLFFENNHHSFHTMSYIYAFIQCEQKLTRIVVCLLLFCLMVFCFFHFPGFFWLRNLNGSKVFLVLKISRS